MNCGDSGARYAKAHTDGGKRCAIEEDPNEKSQSNGGTAKKDTKRGSGLQNKEGYTNGEWKDETTSDLVERSIYVFQSVIAETADKTI